MFRPHTEAEIQEIQQQAENKKFLEAVKRNDVTTCGYALRKGANIDVEFGNFADEPKKRKVFLEFLIAADDTAITYAIKKFDRYNSKKSEKLIQFLLENKANINRDEGIPPLVIAVKNLNVDMVKLFLKHGANPNRKFFMYGSEKTMAYWLFSEKSSVEIDSNKNKVIEIFNLLVQAGFLAKPHQIAKELAVDHCPKTTLDFFAKVWLKQNSDLEDSFTEGAFVALLKTFNDKFPIDVSKRIAFFSSRQVGGILAKTCRSVAENADNEWDKKAKERMLRIKK